MWMPQASVSRGRAAADAAPVPARRLAGTFLHSLFEELDFTQPVPEDWVAEKLQLSGFDAQWSRC
jgi:ATP-dependent exoDNAse (exonuclease V) beta subunit